VTDISSESVNATSGQLLNHYDTLAFAWGPPPCTAVFKAEPEDFQVDEELGYLPSGSGEHFCVRIRKTAVTTRQVVERLSRSFGVREADIGYAGQKDRQGICTQWFSIRVPGGRAPVLETVQDPSIQILESGWNSRKIRLGTHRSNRFQIRLKSVQGGIRERLEQLASAGVPNYFGEQRFGRDGDNAVAALQWFSGESPEPGRFKRGMLLSAARSTVFNEVLSRRIQAGNWNTCLDGDVMNLDGCESIFVPLQWDDVLIERLKNHDIHPTGPLWGRGELLSSAATRAVEIGVKDDMAALCQGLEARGMQQSRRSLRLLPRDMQYEQKATDEWLISFSLPPGTYATAVLREICKYN
jgi:tRNA pseudouridine13 synthase